MEATDRFWEGGGGDTTRVARARASDRSATALLEPRQGGQALDVVARGLSGGAGQAITSHFGETCGPDIGPGYDVRRSEQQTQFQFRSGTCAPAPCQGRGLRSTC